MKTLKITSALLLITQVLIGQPNVKITFPDSLKKRTNYFSPYIKFDVSPAVIGVLKPGEPFDSVYSFDSRFFWMGEHTRELPDSIFNKHTPQTGFQIIADTDQEIIHHETIYKTYKDDSLYASPRYINLVSQTGHITKINCRHDVNVTLAAMPVYLTNVTKDTLHITDIDFTINLTQEILDAQGNWKAIEEYNTGLGCHIVTRRPIFPDQTLVTEVLKYKGSFKTLARLKLNNGNIFYSRPYSISVNPEILSGEIKTIRQEGFLFELHEKIQSDESQK